LPSPPILDSSIFKDEFAWIGSSRQARLNTKLSALPENSLIGLAFSGGGIRSATFNLGVIQGLAKSRLLHKIDYISSVSGGGYISSWLLAWMQHQQVGSREVQRRLRSEQVPLTAISELPEIRFLRNFSNYLTPRKGLFSADFWTFLAIYLGNTTLNLLILFSALLAFIFLPRVVVWIFHALEVLENIFKSLPGSSPAWFLSSQFFAFGLGVLSSIGAVINIGLNMTWLEPDSPGIDKTSYDRFSIPQRIQSRIVLPLLFSSACLSYAFLWFFEDLYLSPDLWWEASLLGTTLYTLSWASALFVRAYKLWKIARDGRPAPRTGPRTWELLPSAMFSGAITGFLFLPFDYLLHQHGLPIEAQQHSLYFVLTFGPPAMIGMMLVTGILHIGLLGRAMADDRREWWARLGACMFLYAVAWLALFSVAIYFPGWLCRFLNGANWTHHPMTLSGMIVWAASTTYGVLFGNSSKTARWIPNAAWPKKVLHYLAILTPYIFVAGFLLFLSVLAAKIFNGVIGERFALDPTLDVYDLSWRLLPVFFACIASALLLAWRVDVNEFSTHLLYRNRLVRCFLGASVPPPRPFQPFTGFSSKDDLSLAAIAPTVSTASSATDGRPYPILNTTLNVVRGRQLALQMRKALSFTFSPLHSGFVRSQPGDTEWEMNYQPTSEAGPARFPKPLRAMIKRLLGEQPEAAVRGVSLGTAMAISGAAASPNMGFYSDPAVGFLLTVFDVRLGWWIGNPHDPTAWKQGTPGFGFAWLARELLGLTNDDQRFIYLSDGGHFENLGIYELVRRRCQVIVASDVSQDPHYGGAELRNAIERCRVDFGVEIYIDLGNFKPVGNPPRSGCHYTIGNISYPQNPRGEGGHPSNGTLILLKPAIATADPFDVRGYRQTDPQFPHDTTFNQWFDEAHFENYRALGETTALSASRDIATIINDTLR
jgi:hypothetical protein